ncbi:MAG: hypothetical protein ACETWM_17105 [Candidatus Lokiarchaeia archaeon]
MKRNIHVLILVFILSSAGLFIYLLGLTGGLFQTSATFLQYWEAPGNFDLTPILLFEVYPRFVLAISPFPLIIERISLITLIFLASAVSAVVSSYLKKDRIALLSSSSALLASTAQFIILMPILGSEPAGLTYRALFIFPATTLTFLTVISSKNLYLLILPAFLFGAGITVIIAKLLHEKVSKVSGVTSLSVESFETLNSVFKVLNPMLAPLLVFILAGLLHVQFFQTEFPHYLQLYLPTFLLSDFNLIWIAMLGLFIPTWITHKRIRDRLAEICIPLLAKEQRKQKLVIHIEEIKKSFGIEPVAKSRLWDLLWKAAIISEEKGVIYFGVTGDYIYFKDPLLRLVKEKLREQGEADIKEIASEINADPKMLKKIYQRLRRENLLGKVRISKNRITPYYTSRTTNRYRGD